MKKLTSYITILLCMLTFAACQDKDFDIQPAKVQPIQASQLTCELQGDDYVITWPSSLGVYGIQVSTIKGETPQGNTQVIGDNKFVHKDIPTNIDYTYVIKAMDKDGNLSTGVVVTYTRPGATSISEVTLAQVEKAGGYDMSVVWEKGENLTAVKLTATNGTRTINETLSGDATSYIVTDVVEGEEWNVSVVAVNNEGPALSTKGSLKIGTTKIGYLSIYNTVEELVANGDDDEVAGWAWLSREYVSAEFVPFSSIKSADQLKSFRVLFWMRDIEQNGAGAGAVFNWPDVVKNATPAIKEWYQKGGSLLLWSHATPYVELLNRIPEGTWTKPGSDFNINTDCGGWNGDTWALSVGINTEGRFTKDNSGHPIFKGMRDVNKDFMLDGKWNVTLIPFKSGGFTEDHNCLFFNLPGRITGEGNQEPACYEKVTNNFGIIPLGTWDGQSKWIGQLNVWEAAKCGQHSMFNADWFSPAVEIPATEGTIICIGNGGCNFNMKDSDGSFRRDLNALPSGNNGYQDNINRLAKNSLEYLKTK